LGIKYALPGALIVAKNKELVFEDRAADRTAKLVAMDLVGQAGEIVLRVEFATAEKLKSVAVPLAGSGLGDDTHDAARSEPVPRVKVVAKDGEFLSRVGIGKRCLAELIVVHVVRAVQQIQRTALPRTVGGSYRLRGEGGVCLYAFRGINVA